MDMPQEFASMASIWWIFILQQDSGHVLFGIKGATVIPTVKTRVTIENAFFMLDGILQEIYTGLQYLFFI